MNFQTLGDFPVNFWLLISNFMVRQLAVYNLNPFKMFYGPELWSSLVSNPCVFEKNVYSTIWGNVVL